MKEVPIRSTDGFFSRALLVLAWSLLVQMTAGSRVLATQSTAQPDGLTSAENEAIHKAKDAEEQLKICLDIANDRLKTILALARKGDGENAAKAVTGFRTAVTRAEAQVSKEQAAGKRMRKAWATLLKATKKYNFALLQALEKVPEDSRVHIQAAFDASSLVKDGAELQLQRAEKN